MLTQLGPHFDPQKLNHTPPAIAGPLLLNLPESVTYFGVSNWARYGCSRESTSTVTQEVEVGCRSRVNRVLTLE